MASTRRFEFGPCLGRGSFGEVYKASMRSPGGLDRTVAVKLLRADLDLNGDAVRRLRDEGRLLALLNHPAVVKVVDLVTLQGRLALITELVEGEDLGALVGEMPTRPLLQSMAQVAAALHAAYHLEGPDGTLNLVHRDVKPNNVRIERHGQAKLLDFGIARFDASDREVRTASDMVVGSVPYMAPERFIERRVHPSSDVFSVGCTLYEGISGDRFYGSNQVAKVTGLALHEERYSERLRDRVEAMAVGLELKEVLAAMLAHHPQDRPGAAEVSERLEEIADSHRGSTLRMWCRDRAWPVPPSLSGALDGQVLEEGELEAFTPVPLQRPVVNQRALETLEANSEIRGHEVGVTLAPPTAEVTTALPMRPSQMPTLLLHEPSQQQTMYQGDLPRPQAKPAQPVVLDEGIGVGGWLVIALVALTLVVGITSLLVLVPGLLYVFTAA